MKYSNQINTFLAITGCIVVLWVFTQTYLQPSRNEQLNIAGIAAVTENSASTQPASYQGENSTQASPVAYGPPSRRSTPGANPSVNGSAAGGGSLQSGTRSVRSSSSRRSSPGTAVSRNLQLSNPSRNSASGYRSVSEVENSAPPAQSSGQDRPADAGGFSAPPAGQALGMEQAKRTPADSSSDRRYVPFRSSMANRPN